MDSSLLVSLGILGAVLALFARQYRVSRRQRARLAVAVLVNGTRGKSSTTRLIAAGLGAGRPGCVLGKTTGTSARWLLPDGTERPITRCGPANIREMAAGLALAERIGATVYVAECMAVRPDYQAVVEHSWMQADVTVLTNIRADHEDVVGQGSLASARGVVPGLPRQGKLVLLPETAALLAEVTAFPRERMVVADPALAEPWLPLFTEPVVPDNLALALTACALLSVPPEQAARGMAAAATDPGNLERKTIVRGNRTLFFVGAFAANDAESTLRLANDNPPPPGAAKGIWFHARPDRRQRTVALAAALRVLEPDFILVSGDVAFASRHWPEAEAAGCVFPLVLQEETALQTLLDRLPHGHIWLLGAGNAKGLRPQTLGEDGVCRKLSSA